jgi:hypothetical protein
VFYTLNFDYYNSEYSLNSINYESTPIKINHPKLIGGRATFVVMTTKVIDGS